MDKIPIDVVCLIYNGEIYLEKLYNQLQSQKQVAIQKIFFVLTESTDNSEKIIDKLNVEKILIKKEDFSHSLTREKVLFDFCKSRIVVMISQDVDLFDDMSLFHLCRSVFYGKSQYTFGRQLSYRNDIEKYIREYNYPKDSYQVKLIDKKNLQLKDFFASDAFAAYDRETFIKLGGYDGLDMSVSEDMYYAHKILNSGLILYYSSNAVVRHSHHLNLIEVYKRYVEIGKFFRRFPYFLKYKNNEAIKLLFHILIRSISEFNLKVLFTFIPNLIVRYFGRKKGLKKS